MNTRLLYATSVAMLIWSGCGGPTSENSLDVSSGNARGDLNTRRDAPSSKMPLSNRVFVPNQPLRTSFGYSAKAGLSESWLRSKGIASEAECVIRATGEPIMNAQLTKIDPEKHSMEFAPKSRLARTGHLFKIAHLNLKLRESQNPTRKKIRKFEIRLSQPGRASCSGSARSLEWQYCCVPGLPIRMSGSGPSRQPRFRKITFSA